MAVAEDVEFVGAAVVVVVPGVALEVLAAEV